MKNEISKQSDYEKIENPSIRIVHFIIDTIVWLILAWTITILLDRLLYLLCNEYVLGDFYILDFFITPLCYYYIMEVTFQKTVAKFFTNTKVVTTDWNKPTKKAILIRTLCRLNPITLFVRWQDKRSNTMVVKEGKNTMKDGIFQIVLGFVVMFFGLIFGYIFSVEQPHYVGRKYAVLFVTVGNTVWLLSYCIYYVRCKQQLKLLRTVAIYVISCALFALLCFYNKPFNSEKWKTELNHYRTYQGGTHSAHANGKMVVDIIESKLLIGLSISEIEELLGKNYYIGELSLKYSGDTVFFYPYSHKPLFDGCDKLSVTIQNGRCVDANFGGCD